MTSRALQGLTSVFSCQVFPVMMLPQKSGALMKFVPYTLQPLVNQRRTEYQEKLDYHE